MLFYLGQYGILTGFFSVSGMPVRQLVVPLPPPDQVLLPALPQLPPATWSPHDSRNPQPQGLLGRRHHRRRKRAAKEPGSQRGETC